VGLMCKQELGMRATRQSERKKPGVRGEVCVSEERAFKQFYQKHHILSENGAEKSGFDRFPTFLFVVASVSGQKALHCWEIEAPEKR